VRNSNGEHESGRDVVDLDVSWLVPADLRAVDALARLQVVASRCGGRLLLHGADGGLVELLDFVGLGDVLHLCPCCRGAGCAGSGLRVVGQTERLEQRRVEERVDGADAPVDDVEDVDGERGGRAARRLGPVDGGRG
jgi:hypothetical protein